MRKQILPLCMIFLLGGMLFAQNVPSLSGLNEAKFVYRSVEDSLSVYFRDSFAFNLGYRDFSFGMKFIAELPKYSTSQSELLEDIDPTRLQFGWKELYVNYNKDAILIHAGTIEETFGSGIALRSFQDIEFDTDQRLTGFKVRYDEVLRLKALYGAIESPTAAGKYDLAYGIDAEYPLHDALSIGGSAVGMRSFTPFNTYNQSEVFSGRMRYNIGIVEIYGEYATRELYKRGFGLSAISGSALYADASITLDRIQFGGAYKNYDQFQFRLQDIPLANHHNETLSDNQGSAIDETGFQGWTTFSPAENISLNLDYAEAWNKDETKKMNDAHAALDWTQGNRHATLSFSHIEKLDENTDHWQKELNPALAIGFPVMGKSIILHSEFKIVEKQQNIIANNHYEPKLQADLALGKTSLSLGSQSRWQDFSSIMESRYWLNMEAKYRLYDHTEIVLFAGKEAGGKVCRNGVCRYVAPFSGLRLELNTRF
ncbi:MAG: DUF6029 family protein [Candidatus Cloacimonadaceae bacterium]|nr:DUF6029 family protein [Candidatus Cloacimonadaceae bacterium]MDP3113327.1 DUF6029 family protein [Candidatus Cloacimonadaceae bacterium]